MSEVEPISDVQGDDDGFESANVMRNLSETDGHSAIEITLNRVLADEEKIRLRLEEFDVLGAQAALSVRQRAEKGRIKKLYEDIVRRREALEAIIDKAS